MKVEWATLADYARSNLGPNTIDIIGGGISKVDATTFPHVIPTIALGLWLRINPKELDAMLDFKMEVVDSTGKPVMDAAGAQLKIQRNPMESDNQLTLPFSFMIQNLKLPRAGRYEFRFLVNGHIETTLPLMVRTQAQDMARA